MANLWTKLATCGFALLFTSAFVNRSAAEELGDYGQYLRGTGLGDAIGAMPPQGLYFGNIAQVVPYSVGQGQNNGTTTFSSLDILALFWVTGLNIFGASYGMAVAQPFFEISARPSDAPGPPYSAPGTSFYPAVHNSTFLPAYFSWDFKNGLHAAVAFAFYPPDGSIYNGTPNPDY